MTENKQIVFVEKEREFRDGARQEGRDHKDYKDEDLILICTVFHDECVCVTNM